MTIPQYRIIGSDLSNPHNYEVLDGSGNPIPLKNDPSGTGFQTATSVPTGAIVACNISVQGSISEASFLADFSSATLTAGSLQISDTLQATGAGGGVSAATITTPTVIGGTWAYANGSVTVTGTLNGSAIASNGGTINAGAIVADPNGGSAASASGTGSSITAGTVFGSLSAFSGGSVTAQQVSPDSSNDAVNVNDVGATIAITSFTGATSTVNSLSVSQGGALTVGNGNTLGANAGDELYVTIDGAGSTYNPGADLIVGQSGLGQLTLDHGASATYGSLTAASVYRNSGPPRGGFIHLSHGSTLKLASATIAEAGQGQLTVNGGSTLTITGNLVLSDQSTASGSFVVSDAGSIATIGGDLIDGQQGFSGNGGGGVGALNGAEIDVTGNFNVGVAYVKNNTNSFEVDNSVFHVKGNTTIADAGTPSAVGPATT
jgi:T5SS/PEP-CTERM-associated repeat protein